MRKSLIITIAAALLLCAVICTAGCIDAPSDPIAGNWVAETDSSVTYAVFENSGAGYFAEAGETDEDAWVLTGTCSWAAAEAKGTYTLTFADGRAVTAVLNAEHGVMTIGGVEYQKYPSELSGLKGILKIPIQEQGPGKYQMYLKDPSELSEKGQYTYLVDFPEK